MTNENPRGLPVAYRITWTDPDVVPDDYELTHDDSRAMSARTAGVHAVDSLVLATDYAALQSDLAAAIARAEAAEAKLAAMEQDAREIYAQIPGLPVTPETCDAVTDVLTRFCMDFNDAIAAQQAEGEDRDSAG